MTGHNLIDQLVASGVWSYYWVVSILMGQYVHFLVSYNKLIHWNLTQMQYKAVLFVYVMFTSHEEKKKQVFMQNSVINSQSIR